MLADKSRLSYSGVRQDFVGCHYDHKGLYVGESMESNRVQYQQTWPLHLGPYSCRDEIFCSVSCTHVEYLSQRLICGCPRFCTSRQRERNRVQEREQRKGMPEAWGLSDDGSRAILQSDGTWTEHVSVSWQISSRAQPQGGRRDHMRLS